MTNSLLAVDDGLVNGYLDIADVLFFMAAMLFGVVTFLSFARKSVEGALLPLGLLLVAVAFLVL